jgi:hypothetical protein
LFVAEYLVNKHINHVKDLVISKDDRDAAAVASARNMGLDPSEGKPPSDDDTIVMLPNPMSKPTETSKLGAVNRFAIPIASSYFAMTNQTDPRGALVSRRSLAVNPMYNSSTR